MNTEMMVLMLAGIFAHNVNTGLYAFNKGLGTWRGFLIFLPSVLISWTALFAILDLITPIN